MNYAVTIIKPPGYIHAEGFNELAEMIHYGLLALGHHSILTTLTNIPDRQHIIFGPHIMSWYPQPLNSNAILFNYEQIDPHNTHPPGVFDLYRKYELWDYSTLNAQYLAQLGIIVKHIVPAGYTPELTRIQHATLKDIDVLFTGCISPRRGAIISQMEDAGLKVGVLSNVYGKDKDRFLARAKLILNIHYRDSSGILETSRIFYPLCNRCTVLSECSSNPTEDLLFKGGVCFSNYHQLTEHAVELINNPQERNTLAAGGFEIVRSRAITKYLELIVGRV